MDELIYGNRGKKIYPKLPLQIIDGYFTRSFLLMTIIVDVGEPESYENVTQKYEVDAPIENPESKIL